MLLHFDSLVLHNFEDFCVLSQTVTLRFGSGMTHHVFRLWSSILDRVFVTIETDQVQQIMGGFHRDFCAWKNLIQTKCEVEGSKQDS